MGRFICLHSSDKDNKEIWINADAVAAVMDQRSRHGWTRIDIYAGPGGYCVKETVESVIGLIEQQTNPLDNYVCPTPVPVESLKSIKSKE
jgi:hypothetical protein